MGILDKIGATRPDPDKGKDASRNPGNFSDVTSDTTSTGKTGGPPADFSDVTAGSSSTTAAPGASTYTVKSGDSLSKIAKKVYGDAGEWRRIYEANRDKISDPDMIHPGQEFTIPAA